MKDNLGYRTEEGNTFFTLKEGTAFKIGQTELTLAEDAEFCVSGVVGRDGIVGVLIAGGAAGVNIDSFKHTVHRKVDGKKANVEVSYDGTGAPMYRLAGSEDRPTFVPVGESIEPEPAGFPAENVLEGVSAGAGVEMSTNEADKLDNALQSMKSDAQLKAEHGKAKSKPSAGKSKK